MNIGIDIIEVKRLTEISSSKAKMDRLFTAKEQEYFNMFSEKLTHIAGFFCAKEAFAKALKTGFGSKLSTLDIEILHEKSGAPYVNIINTSLKTLLGSRATDLSISHTSDTATAVCVIY